MSIATISYGSLIDASGEARSVSRKLEKYADNLNSQVYNKLSRYSGSHTGNISSALYNVKSKVNDLYDKSADYNTYSENLKTLKGKCESVDNSVKTMVSQLTATFKANNDIKNSKIQNTVNYYLTSLKNSSSGKRWLGDKLNQANSIKNYIHEYLEDWWDYEGGKELIKGVAIGVLEVVAGICAVVGAIASGGALIFVIAGVVGGLIATANGIANIVNENAAYNTTKNGDPATGRRRSDVNSWQDYLRSSFIFGDDGEKYEYNKTYNNIATGLDVATIVCDTLDFVDGIGKLAKNFYKWAGGSLADVDNIGRRQLFSKESFNNFGNKVKDTYNRGFKDIFNSFKEGNKINFMDNLKKEFTFDEIKFGRGGLKSKIKSGANVIGNYAGIGKSLVEGDFSPFTIGHTAIVDVILPNIHTTDIITYDGKNGGVYSYDISTIGIKDVTNIFFDSVKTGGDIGKLFSSRSGIHIEVPEIKVPQISIA